MYSNHIPTYYPCDHFNSQNNKSTPHLRGGGAGIASTPATSRSIVPQRFGILFGACYAPSKKTVEWQTNTNIYIYTYVYTYSYIKKYVSIYIYTYSYI